VTDSSIAFSSPTIADGVLYFGDTDNYVYALNATTGTFLWRFQTSDQVWDSASVADGAVYIGSNDGNLYAFHLPNQ
jgi:outer membrane protein assembly factor BamB